MDAALGDPEPELPRRARRIDLPLGPQARPSRCLLVVRPGRVRRRADVEAHRDIRAEPPLDLGDTLRGEPLGVPSYTERKVTPSSSTPSSVSRSENTWNPPESVRIGPSHPENAWSPPSSSISSSPGRKCRWYVFAEDDVGPERLRPRRGAATSPSPWCRRA